MWIKSVRPFLLSVAVAALVALLFITFLPGGQNIVKYITIPMVNSTQFIKKLTDVDSLAVSDFNPLHVQEDVGTGPFSYVRQNGFVTGLAAMDLEQLSTEELFMTLHSYPDNEDVICRRKVRMGNLNDGGWEVCDDPDVRPRDPCIIYSFGINDDFSFDDDVALVYGCHVHSFDPSMLEVDEQFDRSPQVHFHRIGLDSKTYVNDRKWPMYTMSDIRFKLSHHNQTIDIVKMDIESSEWSAVPEMAASGQLDKVRQLLVEYHVSAKPDRRLLLLQLRVFQAVEKLGFRKFYTHKNIYCSSKIKGFPVVRTHCYEVHYLKR